MTLAEFALGVIVFSIILTLTIILPYNAIKKRVDELQEQRQPCKDCHDNDVENKYKICYGEDAGTCIEQGNQKYIAINDCIDKQSDEFVCNQKTTKAFNKIRNWETAFKFIVFGGLIASLVGAVFVNAWVFDWDNEN